MEETLGKRIAKHRKRLGLTQDRLAELLGVTAQAVSKWENDQSCPDINTLPKLSEIFGITTDELLGARPASAAEAEPKETFEDGVELSVGSCRRGSLGLALWLLLAGAAAFFVSMKRGGIPIWTVLWTSGLLTYGLFGLYPRFSLFRFGCALAGGYFLAGTAFSLPGLGWPIVLMVLGALLLLRALQKQPEKSFLFHPVVKGKVRGKVGEYQVSGEHFHCSTTFGEQVRRIDLPKLSSGHGECSFGKLTVDLRGCGEIAEGAKIDLDCSFGELVLLVPGSCRAEVGTDSAFGDCKVYGSPNPGAETTLCVNADVSFGAIGIRYV